MTNDAAIGIRYGVILPGSSANDQLEAAVLAERLDQARERIAAGPPRG